MSVIAGEFRARTSNGYGDRSRGGYGRVTALITEIIMTAIFLYIILGATDDRAPKGFAPIAIGFGLTVIHLASIPIISCAEGGTRTLTPEGTGT